MKWIQMMQLWLEGMIDVVTIQELIKCACITLYSYFASMDKEILVLMDIEI